MATLKVYWCTVFARESWNEVDYGTHRQARVLVATTSQAKAIEAINRCGLHLGASEIRNYGGTTSNPNDIAVAMAEPGTVFYSALNSRASDRDWHRAPITETEK
jgi:hypothetical protein